MFEGLGATAFDAGFGGGGGGALILPDELGGGIVSFGAITVGGSELGAMEVF